MKQPDAKRIQGARLAAAQKPCGTRARYATGCRCDACRKASSHYENERQKARRLGDTRQLVSAEKAREHLRQLSRKNVGYKTVADAAKVATSVVAKVLGGERRQIRASTERRILAVTVTTRADGALISKREADQVWKLVQDLLECGYSKARIASEYLGRPAHALQIGHEAMTQRNAGRLRLVHERLRYASAEETARALRLLGELREEGYRLAHLSIYGLDQEACKPVTSRRGEQRLFWAAVTAIEKAHSTLLAEEPC